MQKSIFITGASSGIGKATAMLFANKGWFVGITDVNEAGLEALKRSMDGKIGYTERLDVTDADRVAAVLYEFNKAAGGKIDILFNCAGILRIHPFEDISLEDHHAILEVNAKGVLNCTYYAFPYLKNTRGSRVINMASVASVYATPREATYSASKFWVRGFTESLNIEWERYGINVCDVMPNFVNTPMVEQNPDILVDNVGVFLTAEDVAKMVWKAAASNRIHWLVDRPAMKLLHKLRGFVPYALERLIMKKMAGF
ncbi:MAG: SDR family oxidoreductase [Syntrophales bacterium]|jgi:short-subunit dehydrogenase